MDKLNGTLGLSQNRIVARSTNTSFAVKQATHDEGAQADDDLEGVLVAKKDFNLPKHNEVDTKNLYVRALP